MEYANKYPEAANSLYEWYHDILKLELNNFNELKNIYSSASIIGDNRLVFNIKGNQYRLIVRVIFDYKTIQIKWFGPHKDYDRINAKSIQLK